MNVSHAVRDVLAEVDFELAQGVVSRPDLRRAIREIRRLHEKNRNAVFGGAPGEEAGAEARVDLRGALRRQFQVDDMILAVLGEAVTAADESRKEARRLSALVRESLAETSLDGVVDPGPDAAPGRPAGRTASARPAHSPAIDADPLDGVEDDEPDAEEDIEWAIRPERLQVPMDARDPGLPLVGSVFGRFRNALHSRVLIYTGHLGEKQTEVNQVLGDHLLRAVATVRRQQATIDALRLRVARLERRVAAALRPREGVGPESGREVRD